MSSQDLPPLVIVEEVIEEQQPAAHPPADEHPPVIAVAEAVTPSIESMKPNNAMASARPVPEFPKNLPHVHINTLEFEQGFPESCLEGAVDGTSLCVICQGYPRKPTTLDNCGHLFCEPCITKWFEMRAAPHGLFNTIKTAPCPACRSPFQNGEILTWDVWQKWAQLMYNAKVIRCPFDCGFKGTASEVDKHQVRACPNRKIDCPVDGCRVRGPADWIEKEHFPRCPFLRIYCEKCRLPVLASTLSTHDCVTRLQEALHGRLKRLHP